MLVPDSHILQKNMMYEENVCFTKVVKTTYKSAGNIS